MQTLPYSEASERNKSAITEVFQEFLTPGDLVWEAGSGTAQHIEYFSQVFPLIKWKPTDLANNADHIKLRIKLLKTSNILPFEVYQASKTPPPKLPRSHHFFTANTLHIMSWSEALALFQDLANSLSTNSLAFFYGPFKYGGEYIGEGNKNFDNLLKQRSSRMGIREFNDIKNIMNHNGFQYLRRYNLPANNQIHCFSKN